MREYFSISGLNNSKERQKSVKRKKHTEFIQFAYGCPENNDTRGYMLKKVKGGTRNADLNVREYFSISGLLNQTDTRNHYQTTKQKP